MESFPCWTSLFTIVLAFALAAAPVILFIKGAFFQLIATRGPLPCRPVTLDQELSIILL